MATLSSDSPRNFGLGDINELPVVASDIIYEGAAVGDNGSGYSRPLAAGDPFQGFALKKADNSSGSAGDVNVVVRRHGLVQVAVTGTSSVADNGRNVYASDDDTFTLTKSTNTKIGQVVRWVTGTTCIVSFTAMGAGASGYAEASVTSLTDSSGGSASNTLAAVTNVDTLTDSTGGTADDTVSAVAAPTNYDAHASGATAVTSNAATDLDTTAAALDTLEDEVTTAIGVINNNFKELTDQIITQEAANTSITNSIASLAAKVNQLIDDLEDLGILTAV